jgi:hypothetical protein
MRTITAILFLLSAFALASTEYRVGAGVWALTGNRVLIVSSADANTINVTERDVGPSVTLPQVRVYGDYPQGAGWRLEYHMRFPYVGWSFQPDCVAVDHYTAAQMVDPNTNRVIYAGGTKVLTYDQVLPELAKLGWPGLFSAEVFADFARHYVPDKSEPNEPAVVEPVIDPNVCTSLTAKYYHTRPIKDGDGVIVKKC